MNVLEQLAEFVKSSKGHGCSKWLEDETMQVYVRRGFHILETGGKIATTLDIANVNVVESEQRKGIFSDFLVKAHEINTWDATYVENVLNPHLLMFLMTNGWFPVSNSTPQSFFMPKNLEEYNKNTNLKRRFYG